jgi:hypothetical protein
LHRSLSLTLSYTGNLKTHFHTNPSAGECCPKFSSRCPSTVEARKEYTTWHKVTVYGGLQKFAATIKKGDLVAVSGQI